ncbi:Mitochondrial ribosomal S34 [Brachionus plicatilis]|uniref:Mitochondrial ribosomal S34 n=1 Tax=Brachionus plicatilis TaxID=10195 RepID=A0A3M7P2K5_BRAPC|nr:Mitochondrial ribosomal S34 [Brachionus plicatilis]
MSKIEYVGRAGRFLGKSLPQICLKLKNFGIGRMFTRETYKRYPEVTYYVLTDFEADMSDEYLRRGVFKADVVFRGGHYGNMEIPGFKEDFQLIAKEEEKFFLERTLSLGQKWREPTKVSKFVDLPPLLKEMLVQEAKEKNIQFDENELKLPLNIRTNSPFSHATYE